MDPFPELVPSALLTWKGSFNQWVIILCSLTKDSEMNVPDAPESMTAVVSTVFRHVLEMRVMEMHNSFRSPTFHTSLISSRGTDIDPVLHSKNPD
jgi:hypothetical protein